MPVTFHERPRDLCDPEEVPYQREEPPLADEEQDEASAVALSDHEAQCLRAAYEDLFGQEYTLTQVALSPIEPSWVVK